ncbi:PREDICTED: glycosylated lysosomal membrane protein B-like [Diuraphis noxia]|uniref:glycosylated lysosomal membrane protein B-like n=1 Tax=Diuraphis noxia TaxID=143948 RepID=UPI000763AB58|nr:PREDICTED: glycosylated lysosomal membrane protein B-like [Diuraphis noxia]
MKGLKIIVFVLTIFTASIVADRILHTEFNPGCQMEDHCSKFSKLTYIRADGDNDTIHFVLDATLKPSLVVIITKKDAAIKVNYTSDPNNSINFTRSPLYTFASVFNNLYEFNDVNDTANMKNADNFLKMDFKKFNWNTSQSLKNNNESVEIILSANSYRAPGINKSGIVSITLKVCGKKDTGSLLPHLVHTPDSGELTLTLNNLNTNFTKSRFAVELLTSSSFPFNKSEELSSNTFSDDKLSGGTFLNYLLNAKGNVEGGGFLSWKPVVYKAENTHALNSSSTTQYDVQDHPFENDWINTPLYKMYGNSLFGNNSQLLLKSINVSFGQPNDEFYIKSNYTYWTFLVGIGTPPQTILGFLELSIIASLLLMLSITMILIFCIFMRWMSSKRNSIIYGQ